MISTCVSSNTGLVEASGQQCFVPNVYNRCMTKRLHKTQLVFRVWWVGMFGLASGKSGANFHDLYKENLHLTS